MASQNRIKSNWYSVPTFACNQFSHLVLLAVILVSLVIPAHLLAASEERILEFHSRIEVNTDGHLVVTETIKVFAAGNRIKRGIYRDFPTDYETDTGEKMQVGFKVLAVSKNGRSEPYHIKRQMNGQRIYIGREDVFLKTNIYNYTLVYQTDQQVGFFEDHDELYWNVTGNDWVFEIEKAGATVILPRKTEILKTTAYTGPKGAREQAFVRKVTEMGAPAFATTRRLNPCEGLTIVVAWPKGIVEEPTLSDNITGMLKQNRGFVMALIGFITLFAYYLRSWVKVGRGPVKGAIIPRFKPPEGLSPAAIRFIDRQRFDKKGMAVALVSLAVKGALTITWDDGKIYTLEKKEPSDPARLSKGEKHVLYHIFGKDDRLELRKTNNARIRRTLKMLKKTLGTDLRKVCFNRNTRYLIPGLGITIAMFIGIVLTAKNIAGAAGWLAVLTVFLLFLGTVVYKTWSEKADGLLHRIITTLFALLFLLLFLGGELFGIFNFAQNVSLRAALFFIGAIGLTVLFYHLIKAPTLYGRAMLDQIEGFRLYLTIAESERLKILNPPAKTPELYEKMLPYAMALDVEKEWSAHFEKILKQANSGQGYRMGWIHGDHPGDIGVMADELGHGLTGALASSSVAPGSSSGFGGGGSSGDGGGGGGGGGW